MFHALARDVAELQGHDDAGDAIAKLMRSDAEVSGCLRGRLAAGGDDFEIVGQFRGTTVIVAE
jgi:hypothetical protein